MQFQTDNLDHPIYIKSYDPVKSELIILSNLENIHSRHVLTTSAVVFFNNIIKDWEPRKLSELNEHHINTLISYKPEILILGVGDHLSAVDYKVLEPLYLTKTPFEVMTTLNACRTYNLLASEHRQVAAALII